jgi:hypothetical protein
LWNRYRRQDPSNRNYDQYFHEGGSALRIPSLLTLFGTANLRICANFCHFECPEGRFCWFLDDPVKNFVTAGFITQVQFHCLRLYNAPGCEVAVPLQPGFKETDKSAGNEK